MGCARVVLRWCLAMACAVGCANGWASTYPDKPVRLLVPFGAGGITDLVARALAEQLGRELGQPVVVENRPGAGGNIAAEALARAPADGYTLMLTTMGLLTVNPHVYPSIPFDPFKSFAFISTVASTPHVIVAGAAVPAPTLNALIDLARKQPEGLAFSSAGVGSSPHQGLEILQRATQAKFLHVPYKSGSESVTAVLGGQAALTFEALPIVLPHLKTGKLKALAIASAERHALEPNLPTAKEAGFPAVVSGSTSGLIGPAQLPAEVLAKLGDAARRAMASPQFKGRLHAQGSTVMQSSPREFEGLVRSEHARWGQIFKPVN